MSKRGSIQALSSAFRELTEMAVDFGLLSVCSTILTRTPFKHLSSMCCARAASDGVKSMGEGHVHTKTCSMEAQPQRSGVTPHE